MKDEDGLAGELAKILHPEAELKHNEEFVLSEENKEHAIMWGVICVFIGLLCGQLIKHACNRLHLPFTPFLTIFGMIVGYCSTLSSYLRHDEFMELSEEDQLLYLEETSHSIGL
jgi:hypothetical protein